ncbi:MAG: hypothetical protein H7841_08290 [Magnetospirillum sp. WYHS-4]
MTAGRSIQILRPGTYTGMGGNTVTFTAADLAAMEGAYDPLKHKAPLCLGHPRHDDPAVGWVGSVRLADGVLTVDPEWVEPDVAAAVRAGRYRHVSAAVYLADAPNNPTPGKPYLRHVGILGAMAPAVKGLKPLELAESEAGVFTVELAEADAGETAYGLKRIGRILRRIKDWLIENQGQETADRIMDGWDLDMIAEGAARMEAQAYPQAALSDPQETHQQQEDGPMAESEEDKKRSAELAEREAKLAAAQAAFAERTARADAEAFADSLVVGNRLAPGAKGQVVEILTTLGKGDAATVQLGDGDAKAPDQALKDLLMAVLPKGVVPLGEQGKDVDGAGSGTVAFAAPDGFTVAPEDLERHARAVAFAKANGCDYMTAVKAVSGK